MWHRPGRPPRRCAGLTQRSARSVPTSTRRCWRSPAAASMTAWSGWSHQAMTLPFDDDTFTHVICQQGFQFFPDPVAAMRETRRVLQPGGVLIATVWATPGQNPYIENQLDLLAELEPSLATSVQRATPTHADDFLPFHRPARPDSTTSRSRCSNTTSTSPTSNPGSSPRPEALRGLPTLAALTDTARQELASAMAARIEPYAIPDGGHRIPFRSYRLHARVPQ